MDDLQIIKDKINIVDLIQEYLPLKRAGINFKANCPFHNEKSPSFIVSPERQIWHCFGCQKGGDIFKFMMEKEGLEFKDALELLAKRAGVVLKKVNQEKKDARERLLEANLKAQEFFHHILTKHKLGEKALEYVKNRGLTDQTIEEFGIGYAPNSWDSLTKFLTKRGFTVQEIIDAGLGVESKNGGLGAGASFAYSKKSFAYDRFRGRIMFPLIDTKGQIIGFSGRVLYNAEPKYINTPQTLIFDKGRYLFGMNLAKSHIRSKNEAVLVEGEMDVIMSHQVGIKNVVASKGTGLTENQVDLLKKYTETISLCFDADLAGDNAARRGIEIAEKAGLNIKVIKVSDGKDPAEASYKDPKIWEECVKNATPIYDYYLQSAQSRYDTKKPDDLRKISAELIPIWAKITDDLVREHYIQKLAALVRTDDQVIRASITQYQAGNRQNYTQAVQETASNTKKQVITPKSRRDLLEEYLIVLLLHVPKDYTFVPKFSENIFLSEKWKLTFVLLVLYLDSISFKTKAFDINEFVKTLPPELNEDVDKLYLAELDRKFSEKLYWQKELDGVVLELKKALVKTALEKLSLEIRSAQEFGKIELVESLNLKFRDLSLKLKTLSSN